MTEREARLVVARYTEAATCIAPHQEALDYFDRLRKSPIEAVTDLSSFMLLAWIGADTGGCYFTFALTGVHKLYGAMWVITYHCPAGSGDKEILLPTGTLLSPDLDQGRPGDDELLAAYQDILDWLVRS